MSDGPGNFIPQSIHESVNRDSLNYFQASGGSSLPFLKGTREIVAILAGALCIFLAFLGVSLASEQLPISSSVLFGLLFIPMTYTNIIVGRLYKRSLEDVGSMLDERTIE